jgi:acetyl-CoA acetyltransferase
VAPLWPDAASLAALQARAFLEATGRGERELAQVAVRSRRDAQGNPNAQRAGEFDVDKLLSEPCVVAPLREHDCPAPADGSAALVLVAGDKARGLGDRAAWIRGIDHRIEPQSLGARDLVLSPSANLAAQKAGAIGTEFDVAELHALYTHQELILREALGLGEGVTINPSGGALLANPMMATGLIRIGEVAQRIWQGSARRGLAHATAGPCLQQNLVCVLEGD